jgi:hypothetical protein
MAIVIEKMNQGEDAGAASRLRASPIVRIAVSTAPSTSDGERRCSMELRTAAMSRSRSATVDGEVARRRASTGSMPSR